ncbi:uncharacterized protein LOC124164999 [Ischnura elegans]|uniref:uncharacterized protein LOC124164999 n=1 Tax=Ischnura elegans TaxID=197161 RepID=UPI001ED867CD|nr:uncharacterized protein LOC124164999 [Ischnura elegans]
MATIQRSPPLEIRHEPQQSHDSGAYIDWNSDSGSPTRKSSGSEVEVSLPVKRVEEFVTVVSVEGGGGSGSVVVGENAENTTETTTKFATTIVAEVTDSRPDVPFVTVLSVGGEPEVTTSGGEPRPAETPVTKSADALSLEVSGKDSDFPTENKTTKMVEGGIVLADSEEVLVYRLPGERLGFGLKFEGGTKTAERVRRLFIQSCAVDSPASRAKCSWGGLGEGDEVVEIDTVPVSLMTRLDCVRRLKESRVVIALRVRPAPGKVVPIKVEGDSLSEPPPVPPRKGQRRGSAPKTEDAPPPPVGFADDRVSPAQRRRASEGDAAAMALSFRQRMPPSPIGRTRLSPEHPAPPEAETYIDLLAQEEYAARNAESESDDTGSSISTVVDRLSLNSVSALSSASSENRSPEHGPYGSTIDLARVLDPFERLEREFSSDSEFSQAKQTITTTIQMTDTMTAVVHTGEGAEVKAETEEMLTATVQTTTALEDALSLQPPPNFQDIPLVEIDLRPEPAVRDMTKFGDSSPEVEASTKESDEDTEDVVVMPPKPAPRKEGHRFRSGKKRPPPPPPPPQPRTDRPSLPTVEAEVPTPDTDPIPEPEEVEEKKEEVKIEEECTIDTTSAQNDAEDEDKVDLLFDCGHSIDLSPERIEEEIEKVAEMWKTEGRKIVLDDDEDEIAGQVAMGFGAHPVDDYDDEVRFNDDEVEEEFKKLVVEELLDEMVDLVSLDRGHVHSAKIRASVDKTRVLGAKPELGEEGEDEEEDEEEEEMEEEMEEDDEDDLMIDSRLEADLWKSPPVDVLFPPFHWSVTQLATIGEAEEEVSEPEETSTPVTIPSIGRQESPSSEEEEEEEAAGEAAGEGARVVSEGAGGSAADPPMHSRHNHLGDRTGGMGEEVMVVGSVVEDAQARGASEEQLRPTEAAVREVAAAEKEAAGEGGKMPAEVVVEVVVSNAEEELEAHTIKGE